jgi:hypothetical protein
MSTPFDDGPAGASPLAPGYPVIDSAELNPVTTRRFRRSKRALHEIPRQPPGSVLVFQLGDSYEVLPEGTMRLDDQMIVDAVAVAVVSLRQTQREVLALLPGADPRTPVGLRASFFCQVTDPQLVLDAGCWDVTPILHDHLNGDRRLRFMAQIADLNRGWSHFQRNATARLIAYHELHPLVVPGLTVRLTDIAVEPRRLATVPRARSGSGEAPAAARPDADTPYGDRTTDQMPATDGNPAFMPDNYTWGDQP